MVAIRLLLETRISRHRIQHSWQTNDLRSNISSSTDWNADSIIDITGVQILNVKF